MGNIISSAAADLTDRIRLLPFRFPPLPPVFRSQLVRRGAIAVVFVAWAIWPWMARAAFRFFRSLCQIAIGYLPPPKRKHDAWTTLYHRNTAIQGVTE